MFYKPLTPEQSVKAFKNEYDFDAPHAIDFDILVEKLRDLKSGKKAEIPIYSFEKHNREKETTTIYSPHVLILEGIFGLHDERVLDLLDLKVGMFQQNGSYHELKVSRSFAKPKPIYACQDDVRIPVVLTLLSCLADDKTSSS